MNCELISLFMVDLFGAIEEGKCNSVSEVISQALSKRKIQS